MTNKYIKHEYYTVWTVIASRSCPPYSPVHIANNIEEEKWTNFKIK